MQSLNSQRSEAATGRDRARSILREPDRDARHAAKAASVRDLAKVGTWKSE